MAMLASKAPRTTPGIGVATQSSQYPHGTTADYRAIRPSQSTNNHAVYSSPTMSDHPDVNDGNDGVRHWDEDQVGDWLRRINCSQYIDLFKKNNITGEILMEMDQPALKEMGIKRIGDRVRIGSQAKLFRNREYSKPSFRNSNRDSLNLLDMPYVSPATSSPRPLHSARSVVSSRSEKRMSRQFTGAELGYAAGSMQLGKPPSRPNSPMVNDPSRTLRPQQYGTSSPMENARREASNTYFAHSTAGGTITSRYASRDRIETPQTAKFQHTKASPSMDLSVTNSSILPADKALIRVIFDNGRSSVVSVENCLTAEEIILKTLKKGGLNEAHVKNYCFYTLEGIEPNPAYCRRINDAELVRMCVDRTRVERSRLILRKVHAGEPQEEQLKTAASIAAQQRLQIGDATIVPSNPRSASKIERMTGESLAPVSYPLSPTSQQERDRNISMTADVLERPDSKHISTSPGVRARKLKDFYGARPPSELIASDLTSYFPDVEKGEIDKTIRMSVRRSRRISRAASRLSVASNFSFASSLKDAPPLPTIADTWLRDSSGGQRQLRPLSVVRLGVPNRSSSYRESVTSSVLEPLEEESPVEPNRKSYVSFGGESCSGDQTGSGSYFDDGSSSIDPNDSLNKRLSQALADDDEGSDEELTEYLENDSWENVKYMKGALIGQGSFGSVYLALHAVTGELMAVKQVELPSSAGTPMDSRRLNMVDALKHEIGLLRDLKHPNIVQYLGSNSDDTHLNIFLEYVPGGSVATMLINYGPLGEGLVSNFVRQILTGLAYLHSKDIIHRDIKGANILVDNKGSVKISDFGISKRIDTTTLLHSGKAATDAERKAAAAANRVSMQGSVFWMAPEVVKQTAYTRKADIWSLGCLIVEMYTGSHPHPNCTQLQAIFKIGKGDATPTIPDHASEDAHQFLKKTFEIDHQRRPTADELLLMPFCNTKV